MTQQVVRARCILQSNDTAVDNSSFDTTWEQLGSDTNVNLTTVKNRIEAFLNTTPSGGTNPLAAYIAQVMSRATNATMIEYYDITGHLGVGQAAGSPIAIDHFTLGAVRNVSDYTMPEGLSVCVGWRVDYGTDVEFGINTRPRARDRNRLYLGPLTVFPLAMDSTTKGSRLNSTFTTDVTKAFQAMAVNTGGPSDITAMVVWSRASAAVKQPLTDGWIDGQWAYQRRRADPQPKVTFAL